MADSKVTQKAPPLSVAIVAWNNSAALIRCLDCLNRQTCKDFETIVVDNGSKDTLEVGVHVASSLPNLRITQLKHNHGFAAANNLAATLARGRWLALLNADAFPEPDWVEQLLRAGGMFPHCFFASRQIQARAPDRLDGEGDEYHVSGLAWRRNFNRRLYPADQDREVFSACAAAAMYPRTAFLEAGGFESQFFSYHEDVDLGFRLRLRGFRCIYLSQAVVYHDGSASTGKNRDHALYFGHRNLVWTYFRNMPSELLWAYLPLHLLMNICYLTYFTLSGRGRAIWRAKRDALLGLPTVLRTRASIQRSRRISIQDLSSAMNRNPLAPWQNLRRRRSES